jgi:HPr kinase/phosphorylase
MKKAKNVSITVKELLSEQSKELELKLIAGEDGLQKEILNSKVQRPGMILYGYPEYLAAGSILVFNSNELKYLGKMSSNKRKEVLENFSSANIACIIITGKARIPQEVIKVCNRYNIPLLNASLSDEDCYDRMSNILNIKMAPMITVHGVLVDVYGVGVLLLGGSGVGKSECALDLIVRGHRLVSDDAIQIKKRSDNILMGTGPETIRHKMELRGLGLINIKDLFGVTSIRYKKRIELIVHMELWDKDKAYDRLGIEEESHDILGVKLPLIRMPVAPGRNIAILVEVAARNYLLKLKGYNAAREFVEEHDQSLMKKFKETLPRLEEEDLE